jgi:hypothetical protein
VFDIHSDILSHAPREETFLAAEGTNEKALFFSFVGSVIAYAGVAFCLV